MEDEFIKPEQVVDTDDIFPFGGGWNHRVMLHRGKNDNDNYLLIHECYYSSHDNDIITTCTKSGVSVGAGSIESMRWVLEKMINALDKPIVDYVTLQDVDESTIVLEDKEIHGIEDIG